MPTDDSAAMAPRILALLRHHLPEADGLMLCDLRRVGGGASTENWLFDASWTLDGQAVRQALVLRCAAANEIVEATREDEFLLLRALTPHPLPTPRAFWMDTKGEWIGRPAMVLERLPGRAERGLLGERNGLGLDLAARIAVARQMADALAAIHAIDVDTIAPLQTEDERPPAPQQLDLLQAAARRDELDAEPELVLAASWLRSHLPADPPRQALVHGDFRPANMLVDQGRLCGVLDWELAHRGDPLEDLGWMTASVYRHEHFIAHAWSEADFLARHAERTGLKPDPSSLRFWQVFAVYKLAVIAFKSMRALARGDHGRLHPPPHRLIAALMQDIGASP